MSKWWIALVCSLVWWSVSAQNSTLSCGNRGCCPQIVCQDGGPGTAISPDSGCRGDVAVIVNWGTCTTSDTNFRYTVNWGDGTLVDKNQDHLGPFQEVHQYKYCDRCYFITVTYQHIGSGCYCPCGDTAHGYIRTMQGTPPPPPLPTCYH